MKQRILDIISTLQREREQAHIVPPHVLTAEIISRGCPNPYAALNDTAFTISKQNNH